MKNLILFSTTYPYTAGIIAILWLGTVAFFRIDPSLPTNPVMTINVILTILISLVGFRR
ncbi:MAG TPA: hypothetical protein VJC09_02200 [Candidatus Saccharimonadales bacterium]|nr:hypothetical protein [Candidatus Saccharimonadales bacterium]